MKKNKKKVKKKYRKINIIKLVVFYLKHLIWNLPIKNYLKSII